MALTEKGRKLSDEADETVTVLTNDRQFYMEVMPLMHSLICADTPFEINKAYENYREYVKISMQRLMGRDPETNRRLNHFVTTHVWARYAEELFGYNQLDTAMACLYAKQPSYVSAELREEGVDLSPTKGKVAEKPTPKFKVGDKVRVVRKAIFPRYTGMTFFDGYMGGTGVLKAVQNVAGYEVPLVDFGNYRVCSYMSESLELVVEDTPQPVRQFQIEAQEVLNQLSSTAAQTKEKKQMAITIKTGVTLINGTNADSFSDDHLINMINDLEAENARLDKTVNKPKKLQAKIDANVESIKALVAIIDGRDPK